MAEPWVKPLSIYPTLNPDVIARRAEAAHRVGMAVALAEAVVETAKTTRAIRRAMRRAERMANETPEHRAQRLAKQRERSLADYYRRKEQPEAEAEAA
jgi:hypothetical protein